MWGKRECKTVSTMLWDYAANRLSGRETETVRTHLQSCASCRVQVAEYQQTLSVVSAYRQQSVPQSRSSWQSLRSRLETPASTRTPRWTLHVNSLGWAAGATCAALLLFVATRDRLDVIEPNTSPSSHAAAAHNPPVIDSTGTATMTSPSTAPENIEGEDPGDGSEGSDFPLDVPNTSTPQAAPTTAAFRSAHSHASASHALRVNSGHADGRREQGGNDDGTAPVTPTNYVLPPASSDDDDPHHYVIDTISSSPRTGTEDSRTW